MIFYYSGCGNSRMAAKQLADRLGERLVFIPDAARAGEYEYTLAEGSGKTSGSSGEMLGFVWPVYCWAPPKLVLDFVSKLKINGRPSHCWTVCTCGDTAGHTEKVWRKALKNAGKRSGQGTMNLSLDAIYSVIMPETYINLKGMMLDTPEGAAKKVAEAKLRLEAIAESIAAGRKESTMILGPKPWLNTYIVRPLFYAFLVRDKYFTVSDACVGCGKCAEVCPLRNITMVQASDAAGKLRPKWNGNCTTCEACYHNCPVNAIQFGKATLGKGQYRGPESV